MTRAILTPIILFIIILFLPIEGQGMIYQPLIFGLVVSLVNLKLVKLNRIFGVILCVVISYIVYYLSIVITLGIGELFRLIEKSFDLEYSDFTTAITILFGGVLSAIILYLCYSFIFKNQKRISGILTILLTALLIPFTVWIFSENTNYTDNADFNIYQISWLIFISLGFGIAINHLEIKNTLNKIIERN